MINPYNSYQPAPYSIDALRQATREQTLADAASSRMQGQAAMTAANAQATPSLQQGSMSGQYFLPWQEDLAQQLGGVYSGLIPKYSEALDALIGRINSGPGGGTTPGPLQYPMTPPSEYASSPTIEAPGQQIPYSFPGQYQMPEAMGSDDYLKWASLMDKEAPQFTDIPISPIYSQQMIGEKTNDIWATQDARAAEANRQAMQTGFGIGSNSPYLADVMAGNMGRAAATGAREEGSWERAAALQNAQHELNQRMAQTNVENLRSQNMWQGSALALQGYGIDQQARAQDIAAQLQGRGQDVSSALGALQGDVSLRNAILGGNVALRNSAMGADVSLRNNALNAAISRELGHRQADVAQQNALLGALGGFGGGLGGFGGILQPLSFSQSGPAGYIFPSDQYSPVAPPQGTQPTLGRVNPLLASR